MSGLGSRHGGDRPRVGLRDRFGDRGIPPAPAGALRPKEGSETPGTRPGTRRATAPEPCPRPRAWRASRPPPRAAGVSRRGHEGWSRRGPSARIVACASPTEWIRAVHAASRGRWGGEDGGPSVPAGPKPPRSCAPAIGASRAQGLCDAGWIVGPFDARAPPPAGRGPCGEHGAEGSERGAARRRAELSRCGGSARRRRDARPGRRRRMPR